MSQAIMGAATVIIGLLVLGVSIATLIVTSTHLHKSPENHHSSHKQHSSHPLHGQEVWGSEAPPIDALTFFSQVAMNLSAFDHTPLSTHIPGQQRTIAGEHTGPLRAARALAIVHVAMADVVAIVTRAFAPYANGAESLMDTDACKNVAIDAAIGAAAKTTLQWLYRGQQRAIVRIWSEFHARLPKTAAVQKGIAFGETVANLIIVQRKNDGASLAVDPPAEEYESNEPGKWRRDPVAQHDIALGATWATHVQPFTLSQASQFTCPPPPNLTSPEYSMEFYETCALGGEPGSPDGCVRDEWRTFVGQFWAYDGTSGICAPARLYLQMVHVVLNQDFRHLDLAARARIIGLSVLAMGDAGLAAWHSKWLYRRERPVTAIRESALFDGNPLTTANPHWIPLGAPNTNSPEKPNFSPNFAAFPSGHAAFGGAMTQVLRRVLGTDEARLVFVSDEFNGHAIDAQTNLPRKRVERWFSSFSEMEEENGQSRVYLGIHWSSDKTAGIAQGRLVADWTISHAYRPL